METKDYCILILSHKRPQFLKEKTWDLLDRYNSTAKRFVILSTDDDKIKEYQDMYGKKNVVVFDKIVSEQRYHIDLMDCYHKENDNKRGTVWARNTTYDIARKLGYRYFIVLDDDYDEILIRKVMHKATGEEYLPRMYFKNNDGTVFDKLCLLHFDMLNSSPFLYIVSYSQLGDYVGGSNTAFIRADYKFKSMNVFFCDTEKEVRYSGRLNDDVNEYLLYGSRGMLSLTLTGITISQAVTQKEKGGMTDIYNAMGTYVKSLYTCVQSPSSCKIGLIGDRHPRIHHNIYWRFAVPCVIDEEYVKEKSIDRKDIMIDDIGMDFSKSNISFDDEKCESIDDVILIDSLEKFF